MKKANRLAVMKFAGIIVGFLLASLQLLAEEAVKDASIEEADVAASNDRSSMPAIPEPASDEEVNAGSDQVGGEEGDRTEESSNSGEISFEEGVSIREILDDGDPNRIISEVEGISIVPPEGWEIKPESDRYTMRFEAPEIDEKISRANMSINTYNREVFADDFSAKEVQKFLAEKLESDPKIKTYSFRDYQIIDVTDKLKGILYYVDFKVSEYDFLQANLVLPADGKHHILSFVDLRERFNGPDSEAHQAMWWGSFSSALVVGKAPGRFESIIAAVVGIGILLLLFIVFASVRRFRAKKKIGEFDDVGFESDLETDGNQEDSENVEFENLDPQDDDFDADKLNVAESSAPQTPRNKPNIPPPIVKGNSSDHDIPPISEHMKLNSSLEFSKIGDTDGNPAYSNHSDEEKIS